MDPEFWLLALKLAKNVKHYGGGADIIDTQGFPELFRELCLMAQHHRIHRRSGAKERSAVEDHVIRMYNSSIFPVLPDYLQEQRQNPTETQRTEAWEKLDYVGPTVDPRRFRLSVHGDVLDRRADTGSPLKAHLDHVFPVARGGLTLSPNLRYVSWLSNHKKGSKVECFWAPEEFACGVSRNLFLMAMETTNCDYRNRSLSFLFLRGEDDPAALDHGMQKYEMERRQQSTPTTAAGVPAVHLPASADSRTLSSKDSVRKNVHFTRQQSLDIVWGHYVYRGGDGGGGKIWKKIQGQFSSLDNKSNADIRTKWRNLKKSGALEELLLELGLPTSPIGPTRPTIDEPIMCSSQPFDHPPPVLSPLGERDMNVESGLRCDGSPSTGTQVDACINGRREFRRYIHGLNGR